MAGGSASSQRTRPSASLNPRACLAPQPLPVLSRGRDTWNAKECGLRLQARLTSRLQLVPWVLTPLVTVTAGEFALPLSSRRVSWATHWLLLTYGPPLPGGVAKARQTPSPLIGQLKGQVDDVRPARPIKAQGLHFPERRLQSQKGGG